MCRCRRRRRHLVVLLFLHFLQLLLLPLLVLHVSEPNETLIVHQHGILHLMSRQRLHPQMGPRVIFPRATGRPPPRRVRRIPGAPVEIATFKFVSSSFIVIVIDRFAVNVIVLVEEVGRFVFGSRRRRVVFPGGTAGGVLLEMSGAPFGTFESLEVIAIGAFWIAL